MSVNVNFDHLTVDLGGNRILDGVDLHIPAGSFVTLLGPSGSGKTTTLNVLAGFVDRSGGHVKVDGQAIDDLPAHARNIGFLFQNYALFPHMTVGENIAFPLQARKIGGAERKQLVSDALRLVQLPDMENRSIRSLSGGQQQRIGLARALVFKPNLLLLDEPLAALDKQLREAMQLELKRIQVETGTTTIAVTHDQVEAMSMADLVAIMNRGKIAQVGRPEDVYRRPADLFVAEFLGEANLLPVAGGQVIGFRHKAPTSQRAGIGVLRPEDVTVTERAGDDTVEGTVELAVFQGTRRRLTVRCPGVESPVIISAPATGADVRPGDQVNVGLCGELIHVVPGTAANETDSEKVTVSA
ncbi:ABC transporter ATP-binding protein [Nocardioides sp. SYSU DS0663]|uniref:ABC transporter ATP-binding protein n=1 Tax=Nocardioides sp. SYSU DS0663 TaxID=3416445 RepID=UPI003F4B17A9